MSVRISSEAQTFRTQLRGTLGLIGRWGIIKRAVLRRFATKQLPFISESFEITVY